MMSNNNPKSGCYFFQFQENAGSERLLLAQIHIALSINVFLQVIMRKSYQAYQEALWLDQNSTGKIRERAQQGRGHALSLSFPGKQRQKTRVHRAENERAHFTAKTLKN